MGDLVKVDLNDLFSPDGEALTRTHEHQIDDRVFTLHELSAGALWAHTDQVENIRNSAKSDEEQSKELNRLYTLMVAKFLQGEAYEPRPQDFEILSAKLGSSQLNTLYTAGMMYNGSNESARDEIAKN